ncbi:MAG: NAD(P)-dependent oxidoreductase [Candidatus Binataceae bacterium]|jgi:3-hydroxyisobutyrate dehydrogenase-like beta-hydroxyacid dehydrogenase
MAKEHLGFIGVGRMGGPMANRLLDDGFGLTICDPSDAAAAPLVARGARRAASPAEVASAVETVLVSLPTPAVVQTVALGDNGVIAGSRVKTFVDLSTTGPRVAATVAQGLAAKGIVGVDSPVSGGITGAQKGTLALMVACPRELLDRLKPILQVIGKVFFIGERPGIGQTMKLVNNLLSAAALAVTAEGVVMGVKAGLDPKVVIDVLNAGSGRNSATQDKFPRTVLTRTFDFGFTTELLYKDVKLCLDEAEALGVPMWVGNAVRQLLAVTKAVQGPGSDIMTVVKCLEQWAGVEVKG